MSVSRLVIVGGGAAGFFGAIACAEAAPGREVLLLEATAHALAKVRVSGGGRCNVTHACFEPRELVKRYPRGSRELLGAFHRFQPRDTIEWFAARNVTLKTEPDGRMFPTTDSSDTIVQCLRAAAETAGVGVRLGCGVRSARRTDHGFRLELASGEPLECERLLLATGGNRGSAGLVIAEAFGHTIEPLAPSLFTFNVKDPRLEGLAGIAVSDTSAHVPGTKLRERGPVLITHWGLSGPGILRLSAWGARELQAQDYRFTVVINWAGGLQADKVREEFAQQRTNSPRRQIANTTLFGIPQRLWERFLEAALVPRGTQWSALSNAAAGGLTAQLTASEFAVTGKSTNKEEFVTCGGVRLAEVDFKTMESRLCPGLHFAGEVLDIDGITGGFNFQAAWTTGHLAGRAMAEIHLAEG